ncbi:MAG: type IV secretory system conjugative DNA transfer family protein [Nitrospirota bacterium]|nr:type IV secretory system conjugative DNA transfer family protein [Nitrospirota bacterium]
MSIKDFLNELDASFERHKRDDERTISDWRVREADARARAAELRAIEAEGRARANQIHEAESRRNSNKATAFIDDPDDTDVLGGGRLGTLADAKKDNLLNPNGLYLGFLEGKPLFYNGTDHLINYGKTRSGKGRDIVLPNLAHVFNRSLVVNDIKDGENAYASAAYRASKGQRVIGINPHGLEIDGITSCRLNPFQRLIDKAQSGTDISADAFQLCMSLIPPKKGDNEWVTDDAQLILATWLEWCAKFHPQSCKLSEMWRFAHTQFDEDMAMILECENEKLAGQAQKIIGWKEAEKQWQAYQSALSKALRFFAPDTPLANVTDASDFDPADLRHEKMTVYLMADSDLLEACGSWISLTISALVNTCAQTQGNVPVTFIIDELANLPYMDVLPKALTLYAGKGIQIYGLCQGREALRDRGYKESTIKNFEAQSGIIHLWSIQEKDLVDDVEKWSGMKTVPVKGVSQGGGAVANAGMSLSYQKRAVLQSDDIYKVGDGQQIINVVGKPYLYIAERVPWFNVPNWAGVLKDVRKMHGLQ